MTELKLCGIIFCALVLIIVFRGLKDEYSLFIRIAITIVITITVLALIQPILSYIDGITNNLIIYKYMPILFKALGITFAVQLTSDCCVDAGEGALAERVNLFGKLQIITISLPLFSNLISLVNNTLK